MPSFVRAPRLVPVLAGVLLAAFLAQCFLVSRATSPTWDETGHLAAGVAYIEKDVFTVNMQHPPLLKDLSGLSMHLAGIHWPTTPEAQRLLAGDNSLQWTVGSQIIALNGIERTMFWARLPFILVACLLGVVIFLWGRELLGETAALGALFLFALSPSVVAHSVLVTTDVGLASFGTLWLYMLWRYVCAPGKRGLVWCGLTLGLMLAAKFSAIFLLPPAAVLLLFARYRMPETARVKAGPNDACPCGSGKKYKKCHGAAGRVQGPAVAPYRKLTLYAGAWLAMAVLALLVIGILYRSPVGPLYYLAGAAQVNADHDPSYMAMMAGEKAERFLSYFAVVYLLKEPLPSITLVILGLVLVWRSRTLSLMNKLFLLLPPAVLFVTYTFMAGNLGIRYLMPVLPFGYLAGGLGLATLIGSGVLWKRVSAAVLGAWMVLAAAGIHPDNLSYFNELACLPGRVSQIGLDGGSRCGIYWLDDHNVDWGQGVSRLKDWAARHAPGRTVKLCYFGSFPPVLFNFPVETISADAIVEPPPPGLYAVSAHTVARLGGWMLQTPPTAIVGHCLYVFDIRR